MRATRPHFPPLQIPSKIPLPWCLPLPPPFPSFVSLPPRPFPLLSLSVPAHQLGGQPHQSPPAAAAAAFAPCPQAAISTSAAVTSLLCTQG